ncbi:MAG: hypothetical protein OEW84_00605 [Aigarchaeota archaeon]|nr:hypothetical protein [Aigarchaeota archaeon]
MNREERLCPRCGKRMSLVAAGLYCINDDLLIDPVTGKPVEVVVRRPVEAGPPEILDRLHERLVELFRAMPIIRIEPPGLRLALLVSYGLAAGVASLNLNFTVGAIICPTGITTDPLPPVLMGLASTAAFLAPILFIAKSSRGYRGGFEIYVGLTCFVGGDAIAETVHVSVTGGPPWLVQGLPWSVLLAVVSVLGVFHWRRRLKKKSRSESIPPDPSSGMT